MTRGAIGFGGPIQVRLFERRGEGKAHQSGWGWEVFEGSHIVGRGFHPRYYQASNDATKIVERVWNRSHPDPHTEAVERTSGPAGQSTKTVAGDSCGKVLRLHNARRKTRLE